MVVAQFADYMIVGTLLFHPHQFSFAFKGYF